MGLQDYITINGIRAHKTLVLFTSNRMLDFLNILKGKPVKRCWFYFFIHLL